MFSLHTFQDTLQVQHLNRQSLKENRYYGQDVRTAAFMVLARLGTDLCKSVVIFIYFLLNLFFYRWCWGPCLPLGILSSVNLIEIISKHNSFSYRGSRKLSSICSSLYTGISIWKISSVGKETKGFKHPLKVQSVTLSSLNPSYYC